jgi:serine/threonine protein kinase
MISAGVTLGGRYRLDERIASGGMGDVWRGTDEVLGRTVAVKILLPALLDEPGFAERFRGEARTMATINHPGVVDIYDYGSDQQVAFLVMEYVEGEALSRTLSRVGRLTPARTMALVAQAADALHAAHQKGIVHRDVKPGNLLVRPNGTLVLTDFGIARSAIVGQLTAAGAVLGTASYISPEQATGGVATASSDVYALGVVAYQCLSGRRPFEGDSALEIAMKHVRERARPLPSDIPPAVRVIVERSMARDPAARWPNAATLATVARQAAATLAAQAHGQPLPAYPGSPAAVHGPGPAAVPGGAPRATGRAPQPPGSRAPSYPPGPRPAPARPAGPPGSPVGANPHVTSGPPANPGVRGAAQVPSSGARPDTRHGPPHPSPPHPSPAHPSPTRPTSTNNRPIMIVLAVILGLLVLLCIGVVSYLANGNSTAAPPARTGARDVVVVAAPRAGHDDRAAAPYRRVVRTVGIPGGADHLSEGRQTR